MEDVIERSIWRPRFSAWIFSALGCLALLLTSAGAYSAVAYTTTLLVRDALLPLAAGLAVSLVASLLLAHTAAGMLLLGIVAIASAGPAWKATAADPLEALQTE